MKIIIAIDDTDDIGTLGTGEILENMCNELQVKYQISYTGITRHQLFIHPDIKYTSHNSSMCTIITTDEKYYPEIISFCQNYLLQNSAKNSDPGLSIAQINKLSKMAIKSLIDWGTKAKNQILTKEMAYQLAHDLEIHLSEHGGTGDGIIGALAGVGLRLSGNDGRFKGKFDLQIVNDFTTVEELLKSPMIDLVMDVEGNRINISEKVFITDKIKTIFKNHQAVLPVKRYGQDSWINLSRKELKGE